MSEPHHECAAVAYKKAYDILTEMAKVAKKLPWSWKKDLELATLCIAWRAADSIAEALRLGKAAK